MDIFGVGVLDCRLADVGSGVVDQYVECFDLSKDDLAVIGAGHVTTNRSSPFTPSGPLTQTIIVPRDADHVGAESQQFIGDAESDAARTAGDESGFAFERPAIIRS